jgi:hypothetical protein
VAALSIPKAPEAAANLWVVSAADTAAPVSKSAAPPTPAQTSTDPAVIGKWDLQTGTSTVDSSWSTQPLPVHLSLLPNGRLLFWGRDKRLLYNTSSGKNEYYDDYGYTTARVWDPFYRIFTNVDLGSVSDNPRTKTNLFCSGHSFLPDGQLLVTGGHRTADEFGLGESYRLGEGMGSSNTNIFDFRTNSWKLGPVMNNGRWYPYNITLGNGETLIVSGSYFNGTATSDRVRTPQNKIPQIYSLDGALRNVKDVAVGLGGTWEIANYPLLHLLSDGRVSMAVTGGNGLQNFLLTPSATNGEGFWERAPEQKLVQALSTGVLYQKDKVLVAGGSATAFTQSETEILELQPGVGVSWTLGNPMNYKRVYHTSTLLPDGKVLITGGTPCDGTNKINCNPGAAINTPELWNHQTGSWTQRAQYQEVRLYHSTAILLPDARVLVGGGGRPAAEGELVPGQTSTCLSATITTPAISACREYGHNNVEIFSPPYLFLAGTGGTRAPRPAITSAPKEVTYGQNFPVGVGAAATPGGSNITAQDIESAVLIRLGSVTHGFNQHQRRVPLTIASRATDGRSLVLTAPSAGNDCPPGYYMLFLMKRNGENLTPSVAKILRVNAASAPVIVQAIQGKGETRQLVVNLAPATTSPVIVELWATDSLDKPFVYQSDVQGMPARGYGYEMQFLRFPDNVPATPRLFDNNFELWVSQGVACEGIPNCCDDVPEKCPSGSTPPPASRAQSRFTVTRRRARLSGGIYGN